MWTRPKFLSKLHAIGLLPCENAADKQNAGQLGLSGFSRPHAVEENRWAQVTQYKQLEKNVADIYSISVRIMLSQFRQLTH